ncbi:MAG TPA: GMC family oxidoreductase [Solirubrobacterales bacterium]|nr:GMC family oxidoreductase [Solirubrobacterales bacterium]
MSEAIENVVIGSGISGLLVARELVAAGREVTVIERGPVRLDADTVPHSQREARTAATAHNTEPAPGSERPWKYGYAFGGSSLLWAGVAPRLLPSDFEMRSRYGIWRDWPIGYDDLLPFYQAAEQALDISGGPHEVFPGSDDYPLPPPPPSSVDRLLGPLLEPFGPLPIARRLEPEYPPSIETEGPEVETASNILAIGRELAAADGFSVRGETVAARLRRAGGRIAEVECVAADGSRSRIVPQRVVAAAHGIENAGLLLRSDLREGPVGRWLGDHTHVVLDVELAESMGPWSAATRDTGISYAWAEGDWRVERGSAVVVPFNPGLLLRDRIVAALAGGRRGTDLRAEMADRFARTAVVYVSVEDALREDRFVELSSHRDPLGLPLTKVSYPPDSDYAMRGVAEVRRGLEERLAPLGAKIVGDRIGGHGGHMLGTCFMGPDGVVDENLRHHRLENLYLTGGSAFATNSALHPTTTIAALAIRLGRHLASADA